MEPTHSSTNSAHLAPFLRTLADTGEVTVVRLAKPDDPLLETGADEILRELDAAARVELAGEVPPLDPAAALWAARQFYRACQLLVCRDVPAEALPVLLGAACPSPRGPATDFAVDLVFRHLPELHAIAHRVAPADALVGLLDRLAREWPLSLVGIDLGKSASVAPGQSPVSTPQLPPATPAVPASEPVVPASLDSFAAHPVLWRLYLDRIAARGADDRLRDPRVRAALAADFGAHPALAPALFSALQRALIPPPPAVPPHPVSP